MILSFPNVKELTESMAVYHHTNSYILSKQEKQESSGVLEDAILCVGDGSTPRSAAIFALYHPEWQCYSIDPQLQEVCFWFCNNIGIHSYGRKRKIKSEARYVKASSGTPSSVE